MKKITSLVLALVLSLSLSVTAFASELPAEQSNDVVTTITVADENGNDVQYELRKDTVTDIPIYAVKEGDVSRSYTNTTTLTRQVKQSLHMDKVKCWPGTETAGTVPANIYTWDG